MNKPINSEVDYAKVGLIISIINAIFCALVLIIMALGLIDDFFFSSSSSAQEAAGWFIFIGPILLVFMGMHFLPDILILVFSYIYKKSNELKYQFIIVILSIIGIIVMNYKSMDKILPGPYQIVRYVHLAFKIVIILYGLFLIFGKKKRPQN